MSRAKKNIFLNIYRRYGVAHTHTQMNDCGLGIMERENIKEKSVKCMAFTVDMNRIFSWEMCVCKCVCGAINFPFYLEHHSVLRVNWTIDQVNLIPTQNVFLR